MASDNNYVQPAIPRFDGHYNNWKYWNIVEIGKLEEQKMKDLKAKNYLFQAIDHSILETILQKDTYKQIWDSMKKKYQGITKSVDEYFSRTLVIVNNMYIHDKKIEDVAVESKDLNVLSIDELQSSLLVHEQRMTTTIGSTEEQALKASTHGEISTGRGSSRGRGRGHGIG
ncbi:hypothetical protein Pfo_001741 [Paulownia fortunei]|nr:hypothetical protein Pfo_001741 [Paulownia fortunei]